MTKPIGIVIIDDNIDDRLLCKRVLQKISGTQYALHEANDGDSGLAAIETHAPACVLLDYSLPGHNGIDVLKTIRAAHPFMPVVMLTGQGNETIAVAAIQGGAQNYISKSVIAPETLEHVIRMAVEGCLMQKRLHEQRTSLEIFTRALAHDLKEPVRTLYSFVDLINQQEKFSEKTAGYFKHIQNAAERMRILIDTVFMYTQLDVSQQMPLQISETAEIMQEAVDNLAQLISERSAEITRTKLPRIYGNRMQLMQVLQNLIGNAINHSEKPVKIQISAEEKPEHWLFRVADNGPGIEEAYLDKIFEPFKRLTHREIQGAGLGLAICRRIIESHGGKIWCESAPGKGATFLFTLPKALPEEKPLRNAPAKVAAAPAGNQGLANVLLVDDSKADVEIAKYRLVDQGHLQCNLFVARGGEEALTLLQKKTGRPPIDLVLLDINMPEMDGFELLERLRADETLKNTAVVMCTGSTYDKDVDRAKALGVVGYLIKPVEFSKLKLVIDEAPDFQLRQENDQYLLLRAA